MKSTNAYTEMAFEKQTQVMREKHGKKKKERKRRKRERKDKTKLRPSRR